MNNTRLDRTGAGQGAQQVGEPMCCGEQMIQYRDVAWECAPSFFALHDDGAIDTIGASPPVLNDDATEEQRQWHEHLLSTRIPIGEPASGCESEPEQEWTPAQGQPDDPVLLALRRALGSPDRAGRDLTDQNDVSTGAS